jgi:hypothetical protein
MNVLALFVCLIAAGIKLPRAARGEGRASFVALVLLALGLLLSIPEVYLVVDDWLGAHNLTNLIIRATVQGVAAAAAVSLARVFDAHRVESFVLSLRGYAAMAVSVVTMGALLVPMGAWNHSSPGLGAFAYNTWLTLYVLIGNLYPAILAALLLSPVLRFVVRSKDAVLSRIAYLLMGIGMVALITIPIVQALELIGVLEQLPSLSIVGWVAPLGFASGMLLHALRAVWTRLRSAQAKKRAAAA